MLPREILLNFRCPLPRPRDCSQTRKLVTESISTVSEKFPDSLHIMQEIVMNDKATTSSRRRPSAVSRSSLVHGGQLGTQNDMWYDVETFLLDQVQEVLEKLTKGSIDDEIWGKIVIMERCKRVAKAYLRKTTVIVDGSEEEFDGKTLGLNHFDNPERDEYTQDVKSKIGDGLILKMDYQGNIKGMARGMAPIICQGWKDNKNNCISDRLARLQGRLNSFGSQEDKPYKMFDMRRFKHALERELHDGVPEARTLLLKTCLRVSLVKDGADMARTPCWFAIVNLVALDMLKEKVPSIRSLIMGDKSAYAAIPPSLPSELLNTQTLTQIIAAAVNQVNKGFSPTKALQSLPVSPEQIAQLATLTLTPDQNIDLTTINQKERSCKPYHSSSSSLDSSGEDSTAVCSENFGINKNSRAKKWEPSRKQLNDHSNRMVINDKDKRYSKESEHQRLQNVKISRNQSITSDYDSNKEHFDSGSWSSTNSRCYKEGDCSKSSPVTSEAELCFVTTESPRNLRLLKGTSSPVLSDGLKEIICSQFISDNNRTEIFIEPEEINDIELESIKDQPVWKNSISKGTTKVKQKNPFRNEVLDRPIKSTSPLRLTASLKTLDEDSGEMQIAALNGSVKKHSTECTIYPKRRSEMEIRYHRPGMQQPIPFVNELRQVLHQRSIAARLPRNHSQPAHIPPRFPRRPANGPALGTTSYLEGSPRGLRRTNALLLHPSQHSSIQQVRVIRTGSVPWSQWDHYRKPL